MATENTPVLDHLLALEDHLRRLSTHSGMVHGLAVATERYLGDIVILPDRHTPDMAIPDCRAMAFGTAALAAQAEERVDTALDLVGKIIELARRG
jgi:hypothetical protein